MLCFFLYSKSGNSRCALVTGVQTFALPICQVADTAADEDAEAQTVAILNKIDALLAEAGIGKSHILTACVYLADISDFDAMNRAWDAWVPQDHKPARTTIEARLTEPALKVEISVVAALPLQGPCA